MEQYINYDSLLILSLLAFITPIIISSIKKVKIPYVVGEIMIGIIFGKSFLDLIHNDIWVSFLSNLGLAYLMFLSGLEIDVESLKFNKNKKNGIFKIIISFVMFGISIIVAFIISMILQRLNIIQNVLFFTVLFTAAAPGIIVPFLKERNILKTDYGQTILLYSLVCEFMCLIALTIISSSVENGVSLENFLFIIVIVLAILIYVFIRRTLTRFDFSTATFRSLHIEVRAAFALILVLVTISSKIGIEVIFGSFLAGIIFTLISKEGKEDLVYKLDIIGYGFLIPIFFIMVGVNLDIRSIIENPSAIINIPIILLIVLVVKFIPSLLMTFKYGKNNAISGAFLMAIQLSLMIVGAEIALESNLIDVSTYSAMILSVVISCVIYPVVFDKLFKGEKGESKPSGVEKICMREFIPTNKEVFNKNLITIDFPKECRVFLIIRNNLEIIPDGNTRILEGDRIIVVGLKEYMKTVEEFLMAI